MITVVIPTYNEAASLPILIPSVFKTLDDAGISAEMVIVDDNSPDGTARVAETLSREYPVRVLVRQGKLGLSSAVIAGFAQSKGDIWLVMDADLSHPPSVVPRLVQAIERDGADLAVGSRYVAGGGMENWPFKRKFVSWFANVLARPFTSVKDATSGFFAIRREVADGVTFNPIGFKIGLEVVMRGKYRRAVEVPYVFTDRRLGHSKFGKKEVLAYLVQLWSLAVFKLRRGR